LQPVLSATTASPIHLNVRIFSLPSVEVVGSWALPTPGGKTLCKALAQWMRPGL
jgi:hypothetical protein